MKAPVPGYEAARLQALRRLAILDTPGEARFDRITQMAARVFGTGTALIGLVDAEHLWFKSTHGLDLEKTPRGTSFCAHVITSEAVMTIEDAAQDPRFADNPLVAAPPHIRFYAGVALRTLDDFAVGTLCLMDRAPRRFASEDQTLLQVLGSWAQSELNITEARNAFTAAHESSVRLQALVDHISDALIVCDAAGCIESCNPAAERLFGYPRARLLGSNVRMLMQEPYHSAAAGHQLYLADYAARRFVAGEFARGADGSQVAIERRVDVLSLRDKEIYCHLIRDVRDRLELENAKSSFLATAAHELRSPLASIHGFTELLIQRQFEPPQQREMLGIINHQAAHMTRLINELLDLARIEARGSRAFEMRDIALAALVEEVVASFMVPPGRSRARLTIEPGLPEVFADPDKIQQALCNVLSNAYKYSPQGGDVVIEVKHLGPLHVAIIVGDMGIGMSAEVMRHAFDRFYRADQAAAFEGTGLGLALVKEIIEHHGGEVMLNSQPGGGTSVMATLLIGNRV